MKVIIMALSLLCSMPVYARAESPFRIEVFTTLDQASKLKITKVKRYTRAEVNVYYVDKSKRELDKLNEEMEQNSVRSEAQAIKLIEKYKRDPKLNKRLKEISIGASSFLAAMNYGISKIPAVVFDEKFIVYGETPLNALKIYNKAKSEDAKLWAE